MKTILFDKEINFENVAWLINEIENKGTKDIQIYFSSNGGFVQGGEILIDYINKCDYNIELIAFYQISSTAFNTFFLSKCKKRIMNFTSAEVHLATNNIDYARNKDINSLDRLKYNEIKNINKSEAFFMKKVLTKKEFSKINQGQDVQLNTLRLKEILKNYE